MSLQMDRRAPGGGILVYTHVETGRVLLELQLFYTEEPARGEYYEVIRLYDGMGQLVFEGKQEAGAEELMQAVLLRPHLWEGLARPYLYYLEVFLSNKEGALVDWRKRSLPLRKIQNITGKGLFLNNQPFSPRRVLYAMEENGGRECPGEDKNTKKERMQRDLEFIRKMGANTICLIGARGVKEAQGLDHEEELREAEGFCYLEGLRKLEELCDRMGLFLWWQPEQEWRQQLQPESRGSQQPQLGYVGVHREPQLGHGEIHGGLQSEGVPLPQLGGRGDNLRSPADGSARELFYYYKAHWSKEPFVYLSGDSLLRQENGNYQVKVYSNQEKVALYIGGRLFEYKSGAQELIFQELPLKCFPAMLTAQAGDCMMSVTVTTHNLHKFMSGIYYVCKLEESTVCTVEAALINGLNYTLEDVTEDTSDETEDTANTAATTSEEAGE